MTLERENTAAGCAVADAAPDEAALVSLLRRNDGAACEEFVRSHAGALLAVARRFFRCEQDAADAVQDAFLSAFRSIHQFAGGSKLSTWLHRIVVNACLTKIRAARSKPTTSIENLLPTFDDSGHHANRVPVWSEIPAHRLHASELRDRVRACIDDLPETYRTVLILRDMEGLDTDQTATELDISPAAVKVRLHRARQALKTLLDPHMSVE